MPSYVKAEYLETASGNKISRKCCLSGPRRIKVSGKALIMPGSIIRGDLAPVSIGQHTIIKQDSVVRPPFKRLKGYLSLIVF